MSPVRPCLGCYRLIPLGANRCAQCQAEWKARERARPNATQRGYDRRWSKTRKAFLAANPRCARCPAPAFHAHHKDGLGPLGPRGRDWSNLEPLCKSCHSRETASTKRWGQNRSGRVQV